jgi:hypothetical protein
MFFGKKERDLVKQVNDELSERIIGQPVAYYPISLEESDFNEVYGEAIEKISLPPIRVFAYVVVETEQTNDKYGYEYQTKLTINFHRKRLVEDQNLYVRVGDFVQYGNLFYEIVRTYNDARYYFGQVEHKFQISAECVRAREGAFRVTPSVDRPVERDTISGEGQFPAPRPVPYPPLGATYITVARERKLPNERVLTAGLGITLDDGGAGGDLTISAPGGNAQGIAGAVQLQDAGGVFAGSSNLVFLTGSDRLGIGTDTPSHELTVIGAISASADVLIGGDLTVKGTLIGASPLKVLDSIAVYNDAGALVASLGSSSYGDNSLSASFGGFSNLSASANVSASYFYGDGSHLTGVTASATVSGDGPIGAIQFKEDASGEISGSTSLMFLTASNTLQVFGALTASANISASSFYGDGSNLTGVTASAVHVADGPVGSLQFKEDAAGEISGSSKILYNIANNSLTVDAGLIHNRTTVITTYTASTDNYLLGVTGVPTEILFDATSFAGGQVLVIKDESGAASSANTITLNASASQTIDGASSIEIESPYGSVLIYSNGSNWFIY